jgi:hypothetical protein
MQSIVMCILLMFALTVAPVALAQGLASSPTQDYRAGASDAYSKLKRVYGASVAWRNAYKRNAVDACRAKSGSLCASSLGLDQLAQLTLAASPQAYDSRSAQYTGGFTAVGPSKNQVREITCQDSPAYPACSGLFVGGTPS